MGNNLSQKIMQQLILAFTQGATYSKAQKENLYL